MNRLALTAALSGLALVSSANAALLMSTNFNTPTYSNAALIGQDGWLITGTSVVNPLAVVGNPADGVVPVANNGQDVRRPYTTAIDPLATSIYYSAVINISAAQTGDYFSEPQQVRVGTSGLRLRIDRVRP